MGRVCRTVLLAKTFLHSGCTVLLKPSDAGLLEWKNPQVAKSQYLHLCYCLPPAPETESHCTIRVLSCGPASWAPLHQSVFWCSPVHTVNSAGGQMVLSNFQLNKGQRGDLRNFVPLPSSQMEEAEHGSTWQSNSVLFPKYYFSNTHQGGLIQVIHKPLKEKIIVMWKRR